MWKKLETENVRLIDKGSIVTYVDPNENTDLDNYRVTQIIGDDEIVLTPVLDGKIITAGKLNKGSEKTLDRSKFAGLWWIKE
jgi:hypothetical protein